MKRLGKIIKMYPEQALLFLFNTGVFAWLQTTGSFIAAKLGFKSIQTEVLLSLHSGMVESISRRFFGKIAELLW